MQTILQGFFLFLSVDFCRYRFRAKRSVEGWCRVTRWDHQQVIEFQTRVQMVGRPGRTGRNIADGDVLEFENESWSLLRCWDCPSPTAPNWRCLSSGHLARNVNSDGSLNITDAFEDTSTCKQFEAGGWSIWNDRLDTIKRYLAVEGIFPSFLTTIQQTQWWL